MSGPYYRGDLLGRWERGEPAATPAPLAVRSRWYRRIVIEALERCLPAGQRRILSLGAGTGRLERALCDRGFDVVASDINANSLTLCRKAGLTCVYCDITQPQAGLVRFDALYADGLLGHFDPTTGDSIWENCRRLSSGYFLLSNDLADTDARSDHAVHGNAAARFLRPPAGSFARSALRSGQWHQVWTRILLYHRPGRGLRRRELLLLRALTDGRTGGREAR